MGHWCTHNPHYVFWITCFFAGMWLEFWEGGWGEVGLRRRRRDVDGGLALSEPLKPAGDFFFPSLCSSKQRGRWRSLCACWLQWFFCERFQTRRWWTMRPFTVSLHPATRPQPSPSLWSRRIRAHTDRLQPQPRHEHPPPAEASSWTPNPSAETAAKRKDHMAARQKIRRQNWVRQKKSFFTLSCENPERLQADLTQLLTLIKEAVKCN